MKNCKDKEQVYSDFLEMVKNSWTFDRMTEDEKDRCYNTILLAKTGNLLSGTYYQRWRQLLAINSAFLLGLGYNGAFWREENRDDLPFAVGVSA